MIYILDIESVEAIEVTLPERVLVCGVWKVVWAGVLCGVGVLLGKGDIALLWDLVGNVRSASGNNGLSKPLCTLEVEALGGKGLGKVLL